MLCAFIMYFMATKSQLAQAITSSKYKNEQDNDNG